MFKRKKLKCRNCNYNSLLSYCNNEVCGIDKINLKPLLDIDFCDDFEEMLTIFSEENTVIKIISSLENSSKEVQIIAKLLLEMHKKLDNIIIN